MKRIFYPIVVIAFVFCSFLGSTGTVFAANAGSLALYVSGFTANGVPMTVTDGVYILNTNGNVNTHYAIQFSPGSSASENLKTENVELKLLPTEGQIISLQNYYATNYPAAYESFLKDVVTGNKPFAYIDTSNTTAIKILDGAQKYLANIKTDMSIPGNYPAGTYTLTGIIHDIALNPATITYTFKVVSGQVLGAEKFNFISPIKPGSRGNEVIELQNFLNAAGYNCGVIDGIFGSKTGLAVINFQIANGLKGDGIVGPLTRALLNK